MKMTVIGGGNIGTLIAAVMANQGHAVTVYTSRPERWKRKISVFDADNHLLMTGNLSDVTSCMERAVKDAQIIWITFPAQLFGSLSEQLFPYVSHGQKIGIIPGSGGAEFAFQKLLEKGCILFGLQRVHSIARVKSYGESVYMLGRKNKLYVGSIPCKESEEISQELENLFNISCDALPNYLSVTLTPSNPILHTTRLYAMFRNYTDATVYEKNFLFYEEWDQLSSEMLIACDKELQDLCEAIPLDLTAVQSLRIYYESDNPLAMTKKISGIAAFQGIASPMISCSGGWVPDFSSRYFTADFSFGLKIIRDIAALFCVPTSNIDTVWNWYKHVAPKDASEAFHLTLNRKQFLELYLSHK